MVKISLGVNQGFVAEEKYPAVAKEGKLVLGTADSYLPQTAEENPGDIIDEPAKPPVRELSVEPLTTRMRNSAGVRQILR